MKKSVKILILLLSLFVIASLVIVTHCNKNRQLYLQSAKWMKGVSPDEYIEVSTLPFVNELVPLAREAAHSGPIHISETSSIREWANEIIETPFNYVDIKVSENEYLHIDFFYD